ncbi:hypothetical protein GCM10007275_15340 [Jeotgalicoccus coquinae]|uniref:Uncharacterized protein n=2 Tax=Jeotgalicoccus TaxID=227979 RepID=A0ABR6QPR6_9STAP|nr:hypothetical protein [Jeotgalicoccus coquinae]MBB6423610.1 hypothetical protein [Jeotgalicoccus coquinae]GGE21219.1 hypothetical protein GCM10007275_15340 [Jeotgalicoccus coquinae]
MFLTNVVSFNLPAAVTLIVYIGGGVTLLLSFVAFFVQTLLYQPKK